MSIYLVILTQQSQYSMEPQNPKYCTSSKYITRAICQCWIPSLIQSRYLALRVRRNSFPECWWSDTWHVTNTGQVWLHSVPTAMFLYSLVKSLHYSRILCPLAPLSCIWFHCVAIGGNAVFGLVLQGHRSHLGVQLPFRSMWRAAGLEAGSFHGSAAIRDT